jgi:hypothetical protein
LKIKLKGCHFDTVEVIEAEPQVVLNASQNMASRMHLKMVEEQRTAYLEGDGSQ